MKNLLFTIYCILGMLYTAFHYGNDALIFNIFKIVFVILTWPVIFIANNIMLTILLFAIVSTIFMINYYLSFKEWKQFSKEVYTYIKNLF